VAWYHTYFKGLPQIAWKLHQDEEYTEYEVDFLRDVLELTPGKQGSGCASGLRAACPATCRAEGCNLTCIDISTEYCEELQDQLPSKKKLPVQVICADVVNYDFTRSGF
jgi:hypothetical protein